MEKLYCHCRKMSKATGAKQPSESQKSKSLWAMKAAKDRGEEYCDPARKEYLLGRTKDTSGVVERTPQRPNCSLHCSGNPFWS